MFVTLVHRGWDRDRVDAVLFDMDGVVVGSDAYRIEREYVERGTPATDVYEHAAATLGVDPAGCVAVEDSANGAAAALDAGMACVGFRPDGTDVPVADHVVAGPDELHQVCSAGTPLADHGSRRITCPPASAGRRST